MTVVAVVYISLVLGVFLRFKQNGIKGAVLWLALFVPFIVFVFPILVVVFMESSQFKKEFGRKGLLEKIRTAWAAFRITLKMFPFLVGFICEIILRLSTRKKKRPAFVEEAMPYFREVYQDAFAHA